MNDKTGQAAKTGKYELLLALIIAVRASSFIFSKMILSQMATFNLLAVRFLLAFGLLCLLFLKRLLKVTLHDFLSGLACGVAFFILLTFEYSALKTTDSGTVSLLENCSIIFVPLFESILYRKRPGRSTVLSALLAITGVFCLTAHSGGLTVGMLYSLLAAVFYAIGILITAFVSAGAKDPLCIGIFQVGGIGFFALLASLLLEKPCLPASGKQWVMILVLSVVCTGFGYTLQPVAQRYVSANRTGLFCAINPAVAAILGALLLKEKFTLISLLGLLLILLSIMLPSLIGKHKSVKVI